MQKLAIIMMLAFGLTLVNPAFAGGPKATHPCYNVADCKAKTSREEFSACIKANEKEAAANAECAEFRKDKPAYMKQNGISGIEALFN
jgi:hypothetical protein